MMKSYNKYKRIARALFFLVLVVGTIWVLRRHNAWQKNEGQVFGTTYHITYQSPTNFHPEIVTELQRVDKCLSLFNKKSWLFRFNKGENPPTEAMAEEVLKLGMEVSKQTGGAFDMTVAPLVNAWGFGNKSGQWPTETEIDSLLQIVGYKRYLNGEKVELDCGAIAKGYAVDKAAEVLRRHGVKNFMVEIGGEVVVGGVNASGNDWNIGVSSPNDKDADLQEIIRLSNAALATSGNYRNYHIDSTGRRVAHTIDPRLGRPVEHSLLSATVKAPTCAMADAYATAFMVMGFDASKAFVQCHPDIQVFFIYSRPDGSYATYNTIR